MGIYYSSKLFLQESTLVGNQMALSQTFNLFSYWVFFTEIYFSGKLNEVSETWLDVGLFTNSVLVLSSHKHDLYYFTTTNKTTCKDPSTAHPKECLPKLSVIKFELRTKKNQQLRQYNCWFVKQFTLIDYTYLRPD